MHLESIYGAFESYKHEIEFMKVPIDIGDVPTMPIDPPRNPKTSRIWTGNVVKDEEGSF